MYEMESKRYQTNNTMRKIAVLMVLSCLCVHCLTDEVPHIDVACSDTRTGSCNFFNLNCSNNNRIEILEANYTIKYSGEGGTSPGGNCVPESPNCVGSCCSVSSPQYDQPYSPYHLYLLFYECSGASVCEAKAQYQTPGGQTSISCSVSYKCVPERRFTKFCNASSFSEHNTSVHLLFENTTELIDKEGPKTCWCKILSDEPYTLQPRDLRLQNAAGHCIETNKLNILTNDNTNNIVTCSNNEMVNVSLPNALETVSGPTVFELTVDPNNKPQMVWIEAVGNSITAQCFDVNTPPSSTELPTTEMRNTTTTQISQADDTNSTSPTQTSLSNSNTPMQTSHTNTSTVTTTVSHSTSGTMKETTIVSGQVSTDQSNNGSSIERVIGKVSDSFPVVAVVVPVIVLLLLGVVVVGIIYRKRLLKSAKPKTVTYANDQTATETDKGPVKTADNYIVLEPENTYTYIDHGDVRDNVSTIETKATKPVNRKAKQFKPTNPGYFTTEPEIIPLTTRLNNKQKPGQDHTYTETTDVADEKYSISTKVSAKSGMVDAQENKTPQSNNYFVLEPQNASEPTEVNKTLQNSEQIQSHNCFVLEPQNTQSSSGSRKGKPKSETESVKANNHNYLELESPDTYSSINPDDVIVQTLPENEYNVLSMNGKPVTRDPSYGTLNIAGLPRKDIEDSGEYSHIQKNSGQKHDMIEYSHTFFRK